MLNRSLTTHEDPRCPSPHYSPDLIVRVCNTPQEFSRCPMKTIYSERRKPECEHVQANETPRNRINSSNIGCPARCTIALTMHMADDREVNWRLDSWKISAIPSTSTSKVQTDNLRTGNQLCIWRNDLCLNAGTSGTH